MSDIILKVENLNIGLSPDKLLLHNVSFDIRSGETYALVGESGSGKTLSAFSVVRLLPEGIQFYSGAIKFLGEDLLRMPECKVRKLRGNDIAFVFQEPSTALNPVLTIGQQIGEILDKKTFGRKQERQAYVIDLLASVEIDAPQRVVKQYPHELSGGMKQRVIIALAIARKPKLLIADEPTTALDVTVQGNILELLQSLQQRLGMGMLFISHNLSIVSNIAHRMSIMRNGRIVESCAREETFKNLRNPYSKQLIKAIPKIGERSILLPKASPHRDTQALLEVRHLSVRFPIRSGLLQRVTDHSEVVQDISFSLDKGKTLALVGESGSGKTTVAKAILHLLEAYTGEIFLEGKSLCSTNKQQMKAFRKRVQVILQDPYSSMNPKMMVGEIIQEGMNASGKNRKKMREKVLWLLNEVGLKKNMIERYPHEFSGGQRQRLCIARALAAKPEILICDEPTSALDVSVQARILDLLCGLQKEHQLSYLLITHDFGVVSYMADEVGVMQKGRLIEHAETQKLLAAPQEEYTQTLLSAVPHFKVA